MTNTTRHPAARAVSALPEFVDRLVDIRQAEVVTGSKRTAIRERVKAGTMPAPVRLSSRCTRWRLSELESYVADPLSWVAKQGATK
jgi:prophage regulatory protein